MKVDIIYSNNSMRASLPIRTVPLNDSFARKLLQIIITILAFGSVIAGKTESITIAQNGNPLSKIVVSEDATVAEKFAANQLCHYLQLVTGARFSVCSEEEVPASEAQILVGQGSRVGELLPGIDFSKLKIDEIIIKRVGNSLVLSGSRPRGSLYAVYQFLENVVGCRWWTPNDKDVPRVTTLQIGDLDEQYAPPFWYRQGAVVGSEEFVTSLCDNANRQNQTPEWGGRYQILGWVHTFSKFLPPERYFKEHPEWYTDPENGYMPCTADSKIPEAQKTELCTTNPAVVDEMTEQALSQVRKNPAAGYISISQNDTADGYCRCSNCASLVEREGSPSALTLQFVNSVAEKIRKEYPDFLIETLAYHYTEKPPKTIKPAEGVVIRMAPILRDFGKPLISETNRDVRKNLEAWQSTGAQMFIWDYGTDFHHALMPHPNLFLIGDALRFYSRHGVKAVFLQGNSYTNGVGDFSSLRTWLVGKLMWNPELDEDRLIDEYLSGYYGAASPFLKKYLRLITDAFGKQNRILSTFNIDFSFLTLSTMNEATKLFEKAELAVKDRPVLLGRVRRERLSVDLAWLWQYRDYKRIAKETNELFLGPKDPLVAVQNFENSANKYGVKQYREGISITRLIPILRGYLSSEYDETFPIRKLPVRTSAKPAIDLQENEFFQDSTNLWPFLADDAVASNGKAGQISPGKRFEIYLSLRGLSFAEKRKWRVFAAVRAEQKGNEVNSETTLTLGVFDRQPLKDVVTRSVSLNLSNSKYAWMDFGAVELHTECILWLKLGKDEKSVLIDRIVLVPDH